MKDCSPLTRQLAWDALPCDRVEAVLTAIGMVPPGPEVSEAEHFASHARLARARPLALLIEGYAPQLAELVCASVTHGVGDDIEIEHDVRDALISQYAALIATCASAILAHLITDGVLTYNTLHTHGEAP